MKGNCDRKLSLRLASISPRGAVACFSLTSCHLPIQGVANDVSSTGSLACDGRPTGESGTASRGSGMYTRSHPLRLQCSRFSRYECPMSPSVYLDGRDAQGSCCGEVRSPHPQRTTNRRTQALWITENSVKQALKRMFRKLEVSSRAQLVAQLSVQHSTTSLSSSQ